VEVLEYAVKHGYAELADKTAPNAIGCKATDIVNNLSDATFQAWVCCFPWCSVVILNATEPRFYIRSGGKMS
jgi:hypothetical protein